MILRAALIACAALLALLALQTFRLNAAQTRTAEALAAHASDRGAWAEASRAASERTRQIEADRTAAIQETAHAARNAIVQAQADAATARAATGRLRDAASALAARACSGAGDTAAAKGSPPTAGPGLVLAELYISSDEMAGDLAEAYDRARIAGLACESAYNSLRR
jgi:hypothetical protein